MVPIRFGIVVLCLGLSLISQAPQAQAQQSANLTGEWEVISVELGIPSAVRLQLVANGTALTGKFYDEGEHIEVKGSVNGPQVRMESKAGDQTSVYQGTFANGALSGTVTKPVKTVQERVRGRPNEQRATNLPRREHWSMSRRVFTGSFPGMFHR